MDLIEVAPLKSQSQTTRGVLTCKYANKKTVSVCLITLIRATEPQMDLVSAASYKKDVQCFICLALILLGISLRKKMDFLKVTFERWSQMK